MMTDDSVSVYAEFLTECKKVIGPFDLHRLAYDKNYKTEFFNSVQLSADDKLFQMAALVDNKLNDEFMSTR
jgi:hypothetical protein